MLEDDVKEIEGAGMSAREWWQWNVFAVGGRVLGRGSIHTRTPTVADLPGKLGTTSKGAEVIHA
ncbi:hypothetical protein DMA15_34525 [Streptomyces sp. WAC 01529]|uniref:hypothetical protein n=1 Tax=Streptomyces sp. WAC 01529 TaxID=2203205 RepID=UPI000F6F9A9E|nr:hypothetical protein [Streptomyces sp. WAC 01529]AZM57054.1 hypothetical protein DMA15_34525 [Streptomyces sp. WAC 01529]